MRLTPKTKITINPFRKPALTLMACAAVLTACGDAIDKDEIDAEFTDVNVIDDSNLNEVMLRAADPNEAASYFQRATLANPGRADLQRGLAISLSRARRHTEAAAAYKKLVSMPGATNEDRVGYAEALVRTGEWSTAEATLDKIPPTFETYDRYRLEAMVADSNSEWKKADSFYETALGLTVTPAGLMNNWGYSKLTRGDYAGAERLFADAIRQDPQLFTAKNNIVLARGAQGKYTLPVVPMTQVERAKLLHTLGLTAVRQGDVDVARGLFQQALDTHPQYFDDAARSLRALDNA